MRSNCSKKNILVLGSSGFIGKNIVEDLSKSHLFSVTGFSSVDINLTDYQQVMSLKSRCEEDSTVVMSAALSRDKGNTIKGMLDNIKMVSNFARIINECPISHLIYISTVDVYGRENLRLPLDESSKLQPSDYYAISKLTCEFVLKKACLDRQTHYTVLRLSGVYGTGDTHNSPIKVFINSVIKEEEITVNGDGSQRRDFLFVKDVGETIKQVCINGNVGVFNIVTGKSFSINQILEIISEISRAKAKILYKKRHRDKLDLVFNESLMKKIIPSFNFTELKEGIEKTYRFYKEEYDRAH